MWTSPLNKSYSELSCLGLVLENVAKSGSELIITEIWLKCFPKSSIITKQEIWRQPWGFCTISLLSVYLRLLLIGSTVLDLWLRLSPHKMTVPLVGIVSHCGKWSGEDKGQKIKELHASWVFPFNNLSRNPHPARSTCFLLGRPCHTDHP